MPNGDDRSWIRLCATLDGFRARYGTWPTRVRLSPGALSDLGLTFSQGAMEQIQTKVQLVPDEGVGMIADDSEGKTFRCAGPLLTSGITAEEWLGVEPDRHE